MSSTRVLSPRALQEYLSSLTNICYQLIVHSLLKGNHNNYISVKVGPEVVVRVHRPIAVRFSQVWKRALQDVRCTVVTVILPPEPAAVSSVGSSAPNLINAPPAAQGISPIPTSPSNKDLLKFVIQWMEQGGADPRGSNAVAYPRGNRPALEKLSSIAQMLEVEELSPRVNRDLGNTPAPILYCSNCKRIE